MTFAHIKTATLRIAERMIDRAGVFMLLALGLATAGATAGVGL
jgi:hypothetical protein